MWQPAETETAACRARSASCPALSRRVCQSIPSLGCCCSVAQSCPTLCDPMACSMPGLPDLHHIPEFTQTHVHRVGDAIQPSHPLSSPYPPAPIPPSIRVFSNGSALCIRWPKYWSFSFNITPSNEHPGLTSFRMDWLDLLAVQGTLLSKRVFSNTTLQRHQPFGAQLSLWPKLHIHT